MIYYRKTLFGSRPKLKAIHPTGKFGVNITIFFTYKFLSAYKLEFSELRLFSGVKSVRH
jgi:hypothetical protein